MANTSNKYRFSFTAGGLLIEEMRQLVKEMKSKNKPIHHFTYEILNKPRKATSIRQFNELALRIKLLTPEELELFADSSLELQRQIAFLSCTRAYGFIRDFLKDVVLEKILLLDYTISDRDYNTFVHQRALEHPELDNLAESTKQKIKTVLYRMLNEAGIVVSGKEHQIVTQYLNPQLKAILRKNDRFEEIKILLG